MANNTELNDLRKIICLRKNLGFSVDRISVYKVNEILIKHGRHGLSAMLHQIFNDLILSAMLLYQLRYRSVTIATTELSPDFQR